MSGTNQTLCCNNPPNHTQNPQPNWRALSGSGPQNFATESFLQTELKSGATFSHMSTYWSAPGTTTLNFRKNAGNGNQTFTSSSIGDTLVIDSSHTDVCAANDLVNLQFNSNNFGDFYFTSIQANFLTPFMIQGSGFPSTGGGGVETFTTSAHFESAVGSCSQQSTSTVLGSQNLLEAAGTISYFQMSVTAAPSGTVAIALQLNGSPGNSALSTTGTTGVIIDTSHTDAIIAGTEVDVKQSSSSAVGTYRAFAYCFAGATSAQDWIASSNGGIATSTTTFYISPGGMAVNINTGAQSAVPIAYGCTASLLRLKAPLSSGAGSLKSYINGSTGNQVATYAGSAGTVIDMSHTDAITANETLAIQLNIGSAWEISEAGMTLNDNSFSGTHPFPQASVAS